MYTMVLQRRHIDKAFSPKRNRTPSRTFRAVPAQSNAKTSSSIKVVIRVRPSNSSEAGDNHRNVVDIVDGKMLTFDPKEKLDNFFFQGVKQKVRDMNRKVNKDLNFMFDNVFGYNSTNNEVFESCTKDLLGSLMEGYNCSVFAYGATGAGKTHTMLGCENNPGITFLTMVELFNQVDALKEDRSFDLGITYVEVYNETVRNLLNTSSGALHIREDSHVGIIVSGVDIIRIHSATELLDYLSTGNKNRSQHPTDSNSESSRSHAVFQVHVRMVTRSTGQVKQVKLSMIDLAGSERGSATGCRGVRFKEGANINKSLLALGNCINSLADGHKHIPYRDSKLTRLLKDSLGGNCQTIMIANISPSSLSYEDTYNTLKYASRAKNIKTNIKKNIVNCEQHVSHYIQRNKDLTAEIEKLKTKLMIYESQSVQRPVVIRKEPTRTATVTTENPVIPSTNIAKLKSMKTKLECLFSKKSSAQKLLLMLQSRDKTLNYRTKTKEEMSERVTHFALDEDSLQFVNSKVLTSISQFGKQSGQNEEGLHNAWEEHIRTQNNLQNALIQVEVENMGSELRDYISYKIEKLNCDAAIFENDHLLKLLKLCRYDMIEMHKLILQKATMLKKYYFLIKSSSLTSANLLYEEYMLFCKQVAGGNRSISWINDVHDPVIASVTLSLEQNDNVKRCDAEEPILGTYIDEEAISLPTELTAIPQAVPIIDGQSVLQKLNEASKIFREKINARKEIKPANINETITLDTQLDPAEVQFDLDNDMNIPIPNKLSPVNEYNPTILRGNLFSNNNKLLTNMLKHVHGENKNVPNNLDTTMVLKESDIKKFVCNKTKIKTKKDVIEENMKYTGAIRKGTQRPLQNTSPRRNPLCRKAQPGLFKGLNKENKPVSHIIPRTIGNSMSAENVTLAKKDGKDIQKNKAKRLQGHPYQRPLSAATVVISKHIVKTDLS